MSAASFDSRADRYDELRPVDGNWWELFEAVVRLGSLRGARVLEVGCGTGQLARALEERELARLWAVDASQAMVDRARAAGVNARLARAEALPFKRGWFDAVAMRMVVHLLDRRRAFAEAARVLGPQGRLAIVTADRERFERVRLARLFPSLAELDRARFPGEEQLRSELDEAGLGAIRLERIIQRSVQGRAQLLELIRERAFSTFDLLPAGEVEEGLARAEAELPERIEEEIGWIVAAASRPGVPSTAEEAPPLADPA